ncbi:MAG: MerR family transcriptional regulator [Hyphomonadaceae bacterium]|nr:MerR family transcriptional regulator [Hyphomonadaceae bacterium]
MTKSGVTIGAAAARSGCTPATIRFYEEGGLLPTIDRSVGGRRVYRRAEIFRLVFIRRCRDLGFPLEQVRALLDVMDGKGSCGAARSLVQAQIDSVRAKRAEMEALEQTLSGLAASCTDVCARGDVDDCTMMKDFAAAQADLGP